MSGKFFYSDNNEKVVADILSRSFMRSCAVFGRTEAVTSWENEDISFWSLVHEQAVAEWVKKNQKPAGKGTDTLREAQAIYLPVITKGSVTVVSFPAKTQSLPLLTV